MRKGYDGKIRRPLRSPRRISRHPRKREASYSGASEFAASHKVKENHDMNWVLIVIVTFGLSHTTGGATTNVAGYKSKEMCEKAGNELGKGGQLADVHVTTFCVPGP
jgi:hypothetical protein